MKIQENISLKEYNTFGIDKKARYFIDARNTEDVQEALAFQKDIDLPLFILGGGSNVLFTSNLDFLVLKVGIEGLEKVKEDKDHVYLRSGAGVGWHQLVEHAIANQWAGVENLSLIPGTVGAAPMQNIGAYGVEIKDVFDHLQAIHLSTGAIKNFDNQQCEFGYRESVFKRKLKGLYLITHVTFRLNKNPDINISYGDIRATLEKMNLDPNSIKSVSEAVIAIRQQKLPDPKKIGNAGSFFKNPTLSVPIFDALKLLSPDIPGYANDQGVKVPAAWLIEKAGWKGKRFGNVGVHVHQPLVLVNYGGGTGKEILTLSKKIQNDVMEKFGVTLEREVNVL